MPQTWRARDKKKSESRLTRKMRGGFMDGEMFQEMGGATVVGKATIGRPCSTSLTATADKKCVSGTKCDSRTLKCVAGGTTAGTAAIGKACSTAALAPSSQKCVANAKCDSTTRKCVAGGTTTGTASSTSVLDMDKKPLAVGTLVECINEGGRGDDSGLVPIISLDVKNQTVVAGNATSKKTYKGRLCFGGLAVMKDKNGSMIYIGDKVKCKIGTTESAVMTIAKEDKKTGMITAGTPAKQYKGTDCTKQGGTSSPGGVVDKKNAPLAVGDKVKCKTGTTETPVIPITSIDTKNKTVVAGNTSTPKKTYKGNACTKQGGTSGTPTVDTSNYTAIEVQLPLKSIVLPDVKKELELQAGKTLVSVYDKNMKDLLAAKGGSLDVDQEGQYGGEEEQYGGQEEQYEGEEGQYGGGLLDPKLSLVFNGQVNRTEFKNKVDASARNGKLKTLRVSPTVSTKLIPVPVVKTSVKGKDGIDITAGSNVKCQTNSFSSAAVGVASISANGKVNVTPAGKPTVSGFAPNVCTTVADLNSVKGNGGVTIKTGDNVNCSTTVKGRAVGTAKIINGKVDVKKADGKSTTGYSGTACTLVTDANSVKGKGGVTIKTGDKVKCQTSTLTTPVAGTATINSQLKVDVTKSDGTTTKNFTATVCAKQDSLDSVIGKGGVTIKTGDKVKCQTSTLTTPVAGTATINNQLKVDVTKSDGKTTKNFTATGCTKQDSLDSVTGKNGVTITNGTNVTCKEATTAKGTAKINSQLKVDVTKSDGKIVKNYMAKNCTVDAPSSVNPTSVDPGSVDPGSVDPGSVDPGSVDPGSVDPGSVDPGSVDPGSVDPGSVNPGSYRPPGRTGPSEEIPGGPSFNESGQGAAKIFEPTQNFTNPIKIQYTQIPSAATLKKPGDLSEPMDSGDGFEFVYYQAPNGAFYCITGKDEDDIKRKADLISGRSAIALNPQTMPIVLGNEEEIAQSAMADYAKLKSTLQTSLPNAESSVRPLVNNAIGRINNVQTVLMQQISNASADTATLSISGGGRRTKSQKTKRGGSRYVSRGTKARSIKNRKSKSQRRRR